MDTRRWSAQRRKGRTCACGTSLSRFGVGRQKVEHRSWTSLKRGRAEKA
jgi:hypothetical protein